MSVENGKINPMISHETANGGGRLLLSIGGERVSSISTQSPDSKVLEDLETSIATPGNDQDFFDAALMAAERNNLRGVFGEQTAVKVDENEDFEEAEPVPSTTPTALLFGYYSGGFEIEEGERPEDWSYHEEASIDEGIPLTHDVQKNLAEDFGPVSERLKAERPSYRPRSVGTEWVNQPTLEMESESSEDGDDYQFLNNEMGSVIDPFFYAGALMLALDETRADWGYHPREVDSTNVFHRGGEIARRMGYISEDEDIRDMSGNEVKNMGEKLVNESYNHGRIDDFETDIVGLTSHLLAEDEEVDVVIDRESTGGRQYEFKASDGQETVEVPAAVGISYAVLNDEGLGVTNLKSGPGFY